MNLRETIKKILREDTHSEEVLTKMINKHILKKGDYPWVVGVYSVGLMKREDNTWEARILIEINPEFFTNIDKHWGNFAKRENIYIYYGMEISKHFWNKTYTLQPFYLEREVKELAERIGLEPHYSLFNTYFVIPPTEEEKSRIPDYI